MCRFVSDCRVWTETAKDEERICEEKSVVNGFVILVLILLIFLYLNCYLCFQPVICTK